MAVIVSCYSNAGVRFFHIQYKIAAVELTKASNLFH